ncbi:MAG: cytochrome c biogenesis protein CcsA [Candidatus Brocadiia bacterium]
MPLELYISLAAFLLSGVAFTVALAVPGTRAIRVAAYVLQASGVAMGLYYFGHEWLAVGYPPLRNLFESLTIMAILASGWNLVQAIFRPVAILGPMTGFLSALLMAGASQFEGPSEVTMPALQHSLWLTTHVLLIMLAYVAVLISALVAMALIAGRRGFNRVASLGVFSLVLSGCLGALVIILLRTWGVISLEDRASIGGTIIAVAFVGGSLLLPLLYGLASKLGIFAAFEDNPALEDFLYRTALIALPLTTLGIITGSVWGDVAWGRYWGWDPKEVWALVTWISLLEYLHLRRLGERAQLAAKWVLVAGLLTVLFNYFGVNFLLAGLHSYAG